MYLIWFLFLFFWNLFSKVLFLYVLLHLRLPKPGPHPARDPAVQTRPPARTASVSQRITYVMANRIALMAVTSSSVVGRTEIKPLIYNQSMLCNHYITLFVISQELHLLVNPMSLNVRTADVPWSCGVAMGIMTVKTTQMRWTAVSQTWTSIWKTSIIFAIQFVATRGTEMTHFTTL